MSEVDHWKETAATFARNADFYRGLVVQIGEIFGKAAYTSDDGSVQHDVLALRVPELVVNLMRAHQRLVKVSRQLAKEYRSEFGPEDDDQIMCEFIAAVEEARTG